MQYRTVCVTTLPSTYQWKTVQCVHTVNPVCTVQHGTVRCGDEQCGTVQYSTVQYSTIQYSIFVHLACTNTRF